MCNHFVVEKQRRVSLKTPFFFKKGRGTFRCLWSFKKLYSKKLRVWTLKPKDQVFNMFKCIHIDNIGQYCGSFDAYCREHGIKHQKTPSKTPQLNGLAKRMNKTLGERVICLLSDAKLSGWGFEFRFRGGFQPLDSVLANLLESRSLCTQCLESGNSLDVTGMTI